MSHIEATRVPVAEWEAEHGPVDPSRVTEMARVGQGPLVRAQLAALAEGYVLEFGVVGGDGDE